MSCHWWHCYLSLFSVFQGGTTTLSDWYFLFLQQIKISALVDQWAILVVFWEVKIYIYVIGLSINVKNKQIKNFVNQIISSLQFLQSQLFLSKILFIIVYNWIVISLFQYWNSDKDAFGYLLKFLNLISSTISFSSTTT